jgi:hypothetical protein
MALSLVKAFDINCGENNKFPFTRLLYLVANSCPAMIGSMSGVAEKWDRKLGCKI